jgi:cytochrome c-type biogenesis protein CcmH
MRIIALLLLLVLLPAPLVAKEATPMAADPKIEARLMALSHNLRCLVCQNQALSGSESDFAMDVRREMRLMMKEGKSDQEIIDFLVQRYGDFILFNPPVKSYTLLLWFGPLLLLVMGVGILLLVLRRRGQQALVSEPLSATDHQRAEALLRGDDGQGALKSDVTNEGSKA